MHVEVSVALNFVISYLYNKLPRRRVDLLGIELEKGLKKKFEGHWYPDKPFKGSGFRCVRVNGEKIDPVIIQAALDVGLELEEMREYLPAELTLWIDPSEVSYRIGEKAAVKILYSDRAALESAETEDQEVQATNTITFNPDAQSFNPDTQGFNADSQGFNPDSQGFNADSQGFNADSHGFNADTQTFNPDSHGFNPDTLGQCFNPDAQSFKPIDTLSASLSNLNVSPSPRGLSPSSPISSSSWGGSLSTSPSNTGMFPAAPAAPAAPQQQQQPQQQQPNVAKPYKGGNNVPQMMTTAMFAQTKFGSTKLKSTAKRPTRLSPTEFNNFLRQKTIPAPAAFQHPDLASPTRSRSLSPRDPRVEFMLDQQQRMFASQQQLQQQYAQQQLQLQQQQQLSFQLRQHQQQQHFQHNNHLNIPHEHHQRFPSAAAGAAHNLGSLHDMFSGPSPLQSPGQSPMSPSHHMLSNNNNNNNNNNNTGNPGFPSGGAVGNQQQVHVNHQQGVGQSPMHSPMHSPMNSLQISPENHKALLEGLAINNVPYSNSGQYHQLLLAS